MSQVVEIDRMCLTSTSPSDAESRLRSALAETRAIYVGGHFTLKSGLHSDKFLQFSALAKKPSNVVWLAEQMSKPFEHDCVQCIVVPNTAASVLGYELALQLRAKLAIVSLDVQGYPAIFAPGFEVPEHDRVLLVLDVLTTGRSLRMLHDICRGGHLEIVGSSVFANRNYVSTQSLVSLYPDEKVEVLADFSFDHWSEGKPCRLCEQGIPTTSYYELQF